MINIVYEDNHLLVVEKPVNIIVQKDNTNDKDLLSMLKEYLKEKYNKPGNVYLGLIHRLDRPVGGIMVFAKTSKAAGRLSEQVRNKTFKKTYLAVVNGKFEKQNGVLEDYLWKDGKSNTSKVVAAGERDAKQAKLTFEVLQKKETEVAEETRQLALMRLHLLTGRHHQIRVQMSHAGMSLLGDYKYADPYTMEFSEKIQLKEIALCANELYLKNPRTKKKQVFRIEPEGKAFELFRQEEKGRESLEKSRIVPERETEDR